MQLIKASERKEMQGVKGVIFGPSGIGKTSLLHTLDPERTLCLDLEAGLLAANTWEGDAVAVRTWNDARALAGYIGPVRGIHAPDEPYGQNYCAKAAKYCQEQGIDKDKYDTIFIDSITVASRLAFAWVKQQPESHDKQGNFSNLKAYGMLGQELMSWLVQLQHTEGKNVWFVGILDKSTNDMGQVEYSAQMEGSKAAKELAGIVDEVITMEKVTVSKGDETEQRRAFICQHINKWNYPAKDRSGVLNLVEPPHLGRLMEKIKTHKRSILNDSPDWEILDDQIIY